MYLTEADILLYILYSKPKTKPLSLSEKSSSLYEKSGLFPKAFKLSIVEFFVLVLTLFKRLI